MLFIAVCDDEVDINSSIEEYLRIYSNSVLIDFETECFESCEKLYDSIRRGNKYDVIFLDIEFEYMNGIQLAEKIREEMYDENVKIVFISGKDGHAMDLFKTRPFDFLIKPIEYEKIKKIMDKIINLTKKCKKTYVFKTGHIANRVEIDDIMYVESRGRKAGLVTKDETYEFYSKLSDIQKSIKDPNFIFIHKSYLININYVVEYKYQEVKMSNTAILPISQKLRKKIREKLILTMNGVE